MDETPPTGPQQDADRTPEQTPAITVGEAARLLGVTPDAIRARLHRGTLEGEKIDGVWRVRVPADAAADAAGDGDRQDATGREDADRTQQDTTQQDPTGTATGVDLAPLAAVIRDQQRRIEELAAASAFWQVRATQAEERLKALEATVSPPEPMPEAEISTGEPEPTPETVAPDGLMTRVWRWIRGAE